jgi:hypothetical protein
MTGIKNWSLEVDFSEGAQFFRLEGCDFFHPPVTFLPHKVQFNKTL